MDRNKLREYIRTNEGVKLQTYVDTAGNRTIGVGFNLERQDAREKITDLGLDFDAVRNGAVLLTDAMVTSLLEEDINTAIAAAQSVFSNFSTLSDVRQIVLTDMAFNLGRGRSPGPDHPGSGLLAFVNLINAVRNNDWMAAANEMQKSHWANQVGKRATRSIEAMRTNKMPFLGSFGDIEPSVPV